MYLVTQTPTRDSFFKLSLTALGTSIDAMAVGVSLAFIKANILLTAALIGLATTIMVTLGGCWGERWARSAVTGRKLWGV